MLIAGEALSQLLLLELILILVRVLGRIGLLEVLLTTLLTGILLETLGIEPGRVGERKRVMAESGGNRRPERRWRGVGTAEP